MSDPHKAVDFLIANSEKFAQAKAQRVYLEEFRKSKKALLMQESGDKAANAQERDAYAHTEYVALLEGLKSAVEVEEQLRWMLIAAQARIEIWRTEQANARAEGKATQ